MESKLKNKLIENGVEKTQRAIDFLNVVWFIVGMGLMGIICLIIKYK